MRYARAIASAIPAEHAAAHALAAEAAGDAEAICAAAGIDVRPLRSPWLQALRGFALVSLHAFPAVFLFVRWLQTGRFGVDLYAPPDDAGLLSGQTWRVVFWVAALLSLALMVYRAVVGEVISGEPLSGEDQSRGEGEGAATQADHESVAAAGVGASAAEPAAAPAARTVASSPGPAASASPNRLGPVAST